MSALRDDRIVPFDEQAIQEVEGNKKPISPKGEASDAKAEEDFASSPYQEFPYWWTPSGFVTRCKRSRFIRYFTGEGGGEVTVADMDALVSLFSLIAAFVLAVPFGAITSIQNDTLQSFKDMVDNCPKEFREKYGDFRMWYQAIRTPIIQAIYASLITIILSLIYYVFRPGELYVEQIDEEINEVEGQVVPPRKPVPRGSKKKRMFNLSFLSGKSKLIVNEDYIAAVNYDFRQWWHRGKIVVLLICFGTLYSIVILCFVFNRYLQTFVVPTDYFCSTDFSWYVTQEVAGGWYTTLILSVFVIYLVV